MHNEGTRGSTGGLLGTRTKSVQLPSVVCNAPHRYEGGRREAFSGPAQRVCSYLRWCAMHPIGTMGVDMKDSQDLSLGAPRSSNLEPGLLVAGCWLAGFD